MRFSQKVPANKPSTSTLFPNVDAPEAVDKVVVVVAKLAVQETVAAVVPGLAVNFLSQNS